MTVLDVERWKRSIVHLEAATDSVGADQRIARLQQFSERIRSGVSPSEDELHDLSTGLRDIRFRGTAIFLEYETGHYLVTARHVLTNADSARTFYGTIPIPHDYTELMIDNWIFPIVFRVPSLTEVLESKLPASASAIARTFLMNLGAGVPQYHSYTFSDSSKDLAVISLNRQGQEQRFYDELLARGYVPLAWDDVDNSPSIEGAVVAAVGFPDTISVLGSLPITASAAHWASAAVSQPVFSWGHVGMRHEALPFFWADVTIYPGNSGGPVIELPNEPSFPATRIGKLVGIVSGQATVEDTRVPFAKVINAGEIQSLLEIQRSKDRGHDFFIRRSPRNTVASS
jgi:hypothetical protein